MKVHSGEILNSVIEPSFSDGLKVIRMGSAMSLELIEMHRQTIYIYMANTQNCGRMR